MPAVVLSSQGAGSFTECCRLVQVLSDIETGQRVSKGVAALSFLASAGFLGQGHVFPSFAALAIVGASGLAYSKLTALQKRFFYEPWSQADLND